MTFMIVKGAVNKRRLSVLLEPYEGPIGYLAGIPPAKLYTSREEAESDCEALNEGLGGHILFTVVCSALPSVTDIYIDTSSI